MSDGRAWVILDEHGRIALASDSLDALASMLLDRWRRGELRGPLRLDEAAQTIGEEGPGP